MNARDSHPNRSGGWRCACLLLAPLLAAPAFAQTPPMTGTAVRGGELLEQSVRDFMQTIGAQATAVAVSRERQLVYSRGFGWRDSLQRQPTLPDSEFRIADVTKPVTAAAVRTLIRADKFSLETRVVEFLKLVPPRGVRPDPRLEQVTVAHLLDHKGGWDYEQSFDPMFHTRDIEESLGLRHPAQPADVIRYMLGRPLQFTPGERSKYCNFGYCLLGRVIEKASGKPYGLYVERELCAPLQIHDIKLARALPRSRPAREVSYPIDDVPVEVMDSHGGLIASAPALCTFFERYWINGEPREPGQTGDFTFAGSLPGATALVRQRPDGYTAAVLLNGSRGDSFLADNKQLTRVIDAAIDKVWKASAE